MSDEEVVNRGKHGIFGIFFIFFAFRIHHTKESAKSTLKTAFLLTFFAFLM